jgi:DNA polymerase III epsilon subunit-like protein
MIAVDIEASGIGPDTHSIVSVGAIDMDDPGRQFYEECRIWEGAHINDEALAIIGMTEAQLKDPQKQTEADLVHHFAAWAQASADRTLAGQNVSFDRDILEAAARRAKHTQWPFAHRTIDVHSLAWMHMLKRGLTPPVDAEKKHSALNLTAVLAYCGIPEEPKPHNALTGAKCHAETISRLLYDKKLLPEFETFDIPWLS